MILPLLTQTCSLPSPAAHTLGWMLFFGIVGLYWPITWGLTALRIRLRNRKPAPAVEADEVVIASDFLVEEPRS